MAADTAQPTAVTLVQNAQNQVVAIKVSETAIPVLTAGMIPGAGCTNLALTIANVTVGNEKQPA
ncbi:hypothetical protein [Methylobacterium platani]|uniref:Uncharacterized protein n=1 Tax=Methylobacterium platani JCM 14648 TaxID=1295136 RepID=A0ABR5H867_9HYPH|nr:hypothetical protein [Methylobacterium platani]KMO20658.1 hypothetical protein SQ03_05405 [Methylobacterium platani JCM 14648]